MLGGGLTRRQASAASWTHASASCRSATRQAARQSVSFSSSLTAPTLARSDRRTAAAVLQEKDSLRSETGGAATALAVRLTLLVLSEVESEVGIQVDHKEEGHFPSGSWTLFV